MTVKSTIDEIKSTALIQIRGRFDFSIHKAFRDAYKNVSSVRKIIVDLSQVEYMDSAALGMLLLLREHAHSHSASVTLRAPRADVNRVLDIANFGRLFEID